MEATCTIPAPQAPHVAIYNLEVLRDRNREMADTTADTIKYYATRHYEASMKLAALGSACGYRLFVANTLADNRLLEKDVGEGLQEILAEVIKLQENREKWVTRAEKTVRAEKKLHREYMFLCRYVCSR
jgi:hypothetical protein